MERTNGAQIRVPKAAEIIAQRIRKSIVRGELKTGDYLPSEAQLLTAYEVSRPTLREAIRILEVEGLLSISRGARRGARIERPSTEMVTKAAGVALQLRGATIGDVYMARTILEPAAARLAAQHQPKVAAAALRAQCEKEYAATESTSLNGIRHEITRFHEILMEQSGNVTLAIVATALKDLVDRHLALVYSRQTDVPERMKQIRWGLRSHERLAQFIDAEDAAGAEAHWLKHMQNAGNFWLGDVADTSVVDILD